MGVFEEGLPRFGFGLMRLPHKGDAIDIEQVQAMADAFLAAGFRYFDTSWGYPGSEDAFRAAVAQRHPRSSYLLATKCPVWRCENAAEARDMLRVSLERTGAGYIDYYLLHNLGQSRSHYFDDYGIWDLVQKQKADGLVRHVGFSFHDSAAALEKILTEHPEMEFVQLQINYADWENPAVESRKCYETALRHGKPVIVMEPVKGGTLARLPQPVADVLSAVRPDASLPSWGIRFAASLPGVAMVLSGMSDTQQMADNLSFMTHFEPLNEREQAAVEQARTLLASYRTIPCTACGYCMEVCPGPVSVPGIFEVANLYQTYGDLPAAKKRYKGATTGRGLKKASECIQCGQCEAACPQHISIRAELAKAAALLEEP